MVMRFLLVCEGKSDAPLASHIRQVIDGYGYPTVDFDVSTDGRLLVDKIRNGLELLPRYNLLFVHRDADAAGSEARYREIENAAREAEYQGPWVGIVPVRMTEAWILLDERAIRQVAGKPRGRETLDLPRPRLVERIPNPKAELERVLLAANGVRGRRRREFLVSIPAMHRRLLQNLPVGGPLEQLESWSKFRDDTVAALQSLAPIP